MSLNGRINVDVLFHDTDGTASLKVVSLEGSSEYGTGVVAVASGTVGTAQQTLSISSYRGADGNVVAFTSAQRAAFQCVGAEGLFAVSASPELSAGRSSGSVCVNDIPQSFRSSTSGYRVRTLAGTGTYTLVLYGT
jgi:hypothetical protein